MMSHPFRAALILAALALAIAPNLATAGPIGWSYTAHVRTTTGLGVLNMGTHSLYHFPSPTSTGGDPVYGDYVISAPLPERRMSDSFRVQPGQVIDEIRLFGVGHGYSVDPVATAPASDAGFLLSFTLTDQASGQSGTIEFRGSVGASTNDQYTPQVLFSGGMGPDVTELQLGGNRYRVTAIGGMPDEIQEPARMGVNVMATANTPEPATLAMAGLGLAAVGLSRLRRGRRSIG